MAFTKEMWRRRWLRSINQLTSFELQKESWLDMSNINPHWTYIEFICCYFDEALCDVEDDEYEHYISIGWISPNEYAAIKEWHEALDKYQPPGNDPYNVVAILNDANWIEIVKTGEQAKNKLAGMLNNEEKQALTEKINYR